MAINPPIWHTKVFFDEINQGNLAAVVLLDEEIKPGTMQQLATEQGLPATTFIWPESKNQCAIRWFSPTQAIQLCGHATLAASFVLDSTKGLNTIKFVTKNDQVIKTEVQEDQVSIKLPLIALEKTEIKNNLNIALNINITKQYQTASETGYVVLELEDINTIKQVKPDFDQLVKTTERAVIITALNKTNNQISFRYFAPQYGNNEDQATGSALCVLADFYNKEYQLLLLDALQLSAQGGRMQSKLENETVKISGKVKFC